MNRTQVIRTATTKVPVLSRLIPSAESVRGTVRSVMPVAFMLALSGLAHAQSGSMDFTQANSLMTSFQTFAIFAGAIIAFGCLIWAGIKMMGGRFSDAVPQLFGALFGAGVLGWGAGWISSLTGQTLN